MPENSVVSMGNSRSATTSIPAASKAARYVAIEGRPCASSCVHIATVLRVGSSRFNQSTPVTL